MNNTLTGTDFDKKQMLFLFAREGEHLSLQNDNVIIKDAEGKIKCQATCYRVFAIFVYGHISVTSALIQHAKKFGFTIVLSTTGFKLYEILGHRDVGNTLLRKKQYSYNSVDIAIHIVTNKILNQLNMLKSIRNKTDYTKEAIEILYEYIKKIKNVKDLYELQGYEGMASKIYFRNFYPPDIWRGRKPRIKFDMINALLDIGYTILFNFIESILSIYGFDLYVGVMHREFYMRKSLVCDIIEPFRVIIDKEVKKGINLKQFKEKDFIICNKRYILKWDKSPDYTSAFINAIMDYKTEIFLYIQMYYRCFVKNVDSSQFPVFNWGENI
ncbi:MAG: CRISPR-associated endonuclease Cas1 [Firmicutes bacterium ADurb.Bin193]|nr:MAG: CRISPR-associated endonuclease Cas1 [Firmicutes bacterium ADurb.Bin193]